MPSISTRRKLKNGVHKKNIDWDLVESALMAGCKAIEIAGHIGIHVDTLYNRCIEDLGVPFSVYRQEKAQKGTCLLRLKQFAKATNGAGNTEMLKWLGTEMLGQNSKKPISLESLSDLEDLIKDHGIDCVLRQPDDQIKDDNEAPKQNPDESIDV